MPARSYRRVAPVGFSRVDAERDARLAAAVELAERVEQQREAEPALSPRLADADRADQTGAAPVRLAAQDRSDLVAVAHDEPQGRIEVRRLHALLDPLLERHRDEVPFVDERLVHRSVERPCVVRLERADAKSFGPLRRGRRRVELDQHPVVAAHLAQAALLEQPSGGIVRRKTPRACDREPALARARLAAREQPRPEPEPRLRGMDEPVQLRVLAVCEEPAVGRDPAVLAPGPTSPARGRRAATSPSSSASVESDQPCTATSAAATSSLIAERVVARRSRTLKPSGSDKLIERVGERGQVGELAGRGRLVPLAVAIDPDRRAGRARSPERCRGSGSARRARERHAERPSPRRTAASAGGAACTSRSPTRRSQARKERRSARSTPR